MQNVPEQDDVVIYDSSLTLEQLKGMWNYASSEDYVEFTTEEIEQLGEDIEDAIAKVIEDFLNWRKP